MRIIIESTEQAGGATRVDATTSPTHPEILDGGAPSAALMQAIAEALPASPGDQSLDGGLPPAWLVEAIHGATQPGTPGVETETDAGSAPSR